MLLSYISYLNLFFLLLFQDSGWKETQEAPKKYFYDKENKSRGMWLL